MSTTTAPIGNDANLAEAIKYTEYLLGALRDARSDNARGDYAMANGRIACVRAALAGVGVCLDTVHDDLVWR